jgi:hypothetical protein
LAYCIGVDLGTASTAAPVAEDGRLEIATLGTRAIEMPFGDVANRRSSTEPTRAARESRQRLGNPTPVLLGSPPFSAPALMGKWLASVIAAKRELLAHAIHQANVGSAGVVTEPEAAALHDTSTTPVAPDAVVAVDDLVGVDFDEAVFRHVATLADGAMNDLDPDDPAIVAKISRTTTRCRATMARSSSSWRSATEETSRFIRWNPIAGVSDGSPTIPAMTGCPDAS